MTTRQIFIDKLRDQGQVFDPTYTADMLIAAAPDLLAERDRLRAALYTVLARCRVVKDTTEAMDILRHELPGIIRLALAGAGAS